MNYDDDELAEAALLLAHTDEAAKLPRALEQKLQLLGKKHAAEARYTTTKAAAVVVESPVVPLARPRSRLGSWAGWIAAAACFAVLVYQWRIRALEDEARLHGAGRPTRMILTDRAGQEAAVVVAEPSAAFAHLELDTLPGDVPGTRYRLWTSSGAEPPATIGDFTCDGGCTGHTFSISRTAENVWITRVGPDKAPGFPGDAGIVASGHRP